MANAYVSSSGTFTLMYPDDWKLVKEGDGTLDLWRKSRSKKDESENILRIRPLVANSVISLQGYTALLNNRKKEYRDLQVIEKSESYIMNFHILKYRKESFVSTGLQVVSMIQDCWDLVISNRIFSCSFTAPKDRTDSTEINAERQTAEKILYSIKLLRNPWIIFT